METKETEPKSINLWSYVKQFGLGYAGMLLVGSLILSLLQIRLQLDGPAMAVVAIGVLQRFAKEQQRRPASYEAARLALYCWVVTLLVDVVVAGIFFAFSSIDDSLPIGFFFVSLLTVSAIKLIGLYLVFGRFSDWFLRRLLVKK